MQLHTKEHSNAERIRLLISDLNINHHYHIPATSLSTAGHINCVHRSCAELFARHYPHRFSDPKIMRTIRLSIDWQAAAPA